MRQRFVVKTKLVSAGASSTAEIPISGPRFKTRFFESCRGGPDGLDGQVIARRTRADVLASGDTRPIGLSRPAVGLG